MNKELEELDLKGFVERDAKSLMRMILLKLWTIQKIPKWEALKRLQEFDEKGR